MHSPLSRARGSPARPHWWSCASSADGILDDAEFSAEKARILSGEEGTPPPAQLAH